MKPLAERMRPNSLRAFVGQDKLVGPTGSLSKIIEQGHVHSMILWGPPGVGKTTLAGIIAKTQKRPFYSLSAIHSGVKDIRQTIKKAQSDRSFDRPGPILFIDEIHRFSKSQQDSLLSAVEDGTITLIGATTENPSFEVIAALLSRCQVYVLEPLDQASIRVLLDQALRQDPILKQKNIKILEDNALCRYAGGDARKAFNILEIISTDAKENEEIEITDQIIEDKLQQNLSRYDKSGEQHYDIVSAFIKSIRGSDPDATLYWMARMLHGGEDVKFIARRMIISAAEDIGLANPTALLMANAGFDAVSKIGMPEARIVLSEVAVYLASSPKSNATYRAIDDALQAVNNSGDLPVPLHLRNAPTQLMKSLNYGKAYTYAHNHPGHFLKQQYLPDQLTDTVFYTPGKSPQEIKIKERLDQLWSRKS